MRWVWHDLCMYVCIRDLRSFEIRFEFEFESDVPIRIWFESDVPIRNFRISRTCRVPSYHKLRSLTVQQNINLCAVFIWDLCLQLHFTCSCTAVARAHTQLPYDNRHWTCKRLPPDSVRYSIKIRIVAAYSFRDLIRTEISYSPVPSMYVCMYV